MGSAKDEPQRYDDEDPQHQVTIPKPLAIGRCAVTRGQFAAFVSATGDHLRGRGSICGAIPALAQSHDHPVVRENWNDAQATVSWLSITCGASLPPAFGGGVGNNTQPNQ